MPTEKRQRQKEGQRARREAAQAALRTRQRKRRGITAVVAAVAVLAVMLLISVLGGDDDTNVSTDADGTASSTTNTTEEPTKVDPADKPEVGIPEGPAPTELRIDDITVGEGREAKVGDEVEVNYVGVTFADGKEFDSSWTRGQTATFTLDENNLIKGWVEGIPGMKVGGRRRLIIPGSLAYGDEDTGTGRPYGALVFVIDLLDIKEPLRAGR